MLKQIHRTYDPKWSFQKRKSAVSLINNQSSYSPMKHQTTIVLSSTIVAIVAISLLGFNTLSATPFLVAQDVKQPSAGSSILGHVIYVVKDRDGNIKNYIQGDNVVTQRGHGCAVQMLFANSTTSITGGSPCSTITGAGTRGAIFNFIAIGNGTNTISATGADTTLPAGGPADEAVARIQGTVTLDTPATNQARATITTTSPFAFTQMAGNNVLTSSGLFNRQSTCAVGGCSVANANGDLFADQAISVTVAPSDTLSVTWKITMS